MGGGVVPGRRCCCRRCTLARTHPRSTNFRSCTHAFRSLGACRGRTDPCRSPRSRKTSPPDLHGKRCHTVCRCAQSTTGQGCDEPWNRPPRHSPTYCKWDAKDRSDWVGPGHAANHTHLVPASIPHLALALGETLGPFSLVHVSVAVAHGAVAVEQVVLKLWLRVSHTPPATKPRPRAPPE